MRTATWCRPGEGWTHDPYGAVEQGRRDLRPRRGGVEVGFLDLCVRHAGVRRTIPPASTARSNCISPTTRRPAASSGPKWLLDEKITKPDYAISAGFSYAVITAHNGVLHLEVTVKGRQAHAAMPESGADALEAATGVLAALYNERRRLGEAQIEIARHRFGQS